MEFIFENWQLIVFAVALLVLAIVYLYRANMDTLKNWLVYAVSEAEKYYESGTGQLKLNYVYDLFVARYPHVSIFISFEKFSSLVDTALESLEELLKSDSISAFINGTSDEEAGE